MKKVMQLAERHFLRKLVQEIKKHSKNKKSAMKEINIPSNKGHGVMDQEVNDGENELSNHYDDMSHDSSDSIEDENKDFANESFDEGEKDNQENGQDEDDNDKDLDEIYNADILDLNSDNEDQKESLIHERLNCDNMKKYVELPEKSKIKEILNSFPILTEYSFDSTNYQWFQISFELSASASKTFLNPLLKRLADKIKLNNVPDVTRCFISSTNTSVDGEMKVFNVEGDNMRELWKFPDILDLNKVYCNNIKKVADAYGIEAARSTMIKEIQNVFAVYGITVNYRHLSLLTDYMTFNGTYQACNRHGIKYCASPFQKMSFESTMFFLKDACIFGHKDSVESPSAKLVTGRPVNVGTNSFDVLTKWNVKK